MLERASCLSIVLLPTDSISCHLLSLTRTCCSSEWWRIWNIKLYFPTPQIKPSRRTWLCPSSICWIFQQLSPQTIFIFGYIMSSTRLIDTNDFSSYLFVHYFILTFFFPFYFYLPPPLPPPHTSPLPHRQCEVPRTSLDFRVQSSTAQKVITSQIPDMGCPLVSGIHIPRSLHNLVRDHFTVAIWVWQIHAHTDTQHSQTDISS